MLRLTFALWMHHRCQQLPPSLSWSQLRSLSKFHVQSAQFSALTVPEIHKSHRWFDNRRSQIGSFECFRFFSSAHTFCENPERHVANGQRRSRALPLELNKLSASAAANYILQAFQSGRKVLRMDLHLVLDKCSQSGASKHAQLVFDEMCAAGIKPNRYTFRLLIHCHGVSKQPTHIMRFYHELRQIVGGPLSRKDYNTVLDSLSRCGELNSFEIVYSDMKADGVLPDDKTLVSAMTCYSRAEQQDDLDSAFEQYVQQKEKLGTPCSEYVFNVYMTHYASKGDVVKCKEILDLWNRFESTRNPFLLTTLMAAHARIGDADACSAIFGNEFGDSQNRASVAPATLNTLIHGYIRSGQVDKAQQFLSLFHKYKIAPQITTFIMLMHAQAEAANVAQVRVLMKAMSQQGLRVGARAYAMLVRAMYMRGDPPQAIEHVFDDMLANNARPLPFAFESLYLAYVNIQDARGCETTLRRMHSLGISIPPTLSVEVDQ
eukprot:gene10612-2734_t